MQLIEKNKARTIFTLLSNNSRKLPNQDHCEQHNCNICFEQFRETCNAFLINNKKIQFILPAFPAKSPNHEKTAGVLPDLGEQLSLLALNKICEKIQLIHEPGAQITICSDGRVFNDVLEVTDYHVTAYRLGIEKIIKQQSLSHLNTYNLEEFYQESSYEIMRNKLMQDFSEDMSTLVARIKNKEEDLRLFNGMHRFIYEDFLSLNMDSLSKNKIKTLAKINTYLVIQRSNAWSNLIKKQFPEAIRLSIHPQLCGSKKIGIMLLKSENQWATPWHRVVLQQGKDFFLVKKKYAEAINAKDIYINGQFSHYTIHQNERILCA